MENNDLTQFVNDYPISRDNLKDVKDFLRYLGKQSLVDKKFNDYVDIFVARMVAFGFDNHYALRLATSTFSVATCYKYQSLNTLLGGINDEGDYQFDICGGNLKDDTERAEFQTEFDAVIKSFTKNQTAHYDLLVQNFTAEEIALILGKTNDSVYKIIRTLEDKLEKFRCYLIEKRKEINKNDLTN